MKALNYPATLLRSLKVLATTLALNSFVVNASPTHPFKTDPTLENRLDEVLSTLTTQTPKDRPPLPGSAVLRIEDINGELIYSNAVGNARYGSDDPMTTEHQFIISSITKSFVATVILQLWEQGHFGEKGLDTTLKDVQLFDDKLLDKLQVYNGVSYGRDITLRHLLMHRSGLGFGWANLGIPFQSFTDIFETHFVCSQQPECDTGKLRTSKQWVRWDEQHPLDPDAGLVNSYLSAQFKQSQSTAAPDEKHEYRDINFWMLALVAQKITEKPLYQILRERIFDPLEMDNTYMMYTGDPIEESHSNNPSDYYVSGYPGFTSGINFSMDWAGGGLVTNAEELARFLRALITGKLFKKPATFAAMTDWHSETGKSRAATEHVGLGFYKTEFHGHSLIGHTGFIYAFMFYDPASRLVYTGTFNRTSGSFFTTLSNIIQSVENKPSNSQHNP